MIDDKTILALQKEAAEAAKAWPEHLRDSFQVDFVQSAIDFSVKVSTHKNDFEHKVADLLSTGLVVEKDAIKKRMSSLQAVFELAMLAVETEERTDVSSVMLTNLQNLFEEIKKMQDQMRLKNIHRMGFYPGD